MRILKISDGFITNSSSDNMVIVIAVRKSKDLFKELKKICEKLAIPKEFIPEFYDGVEDYEGEVDHLRDEYYFYNSSPTTYISGDGIYQIPNAEFNGIVKLFEYIKTSQDEDLIVLEFRESVVY